MSNEKVPSAPITFIPEAISPTSRILAKWATADSISVHTTQLAKPTVPGGGSASSTCTVYHLKSEAILFDPVLRKLVNESCCNFLSGQLLKNTPASTRDSELLKLSRKYRSILRASIENFQDVSTDNKETTKEYYNNIIAILYNIEFIWHLTEILHVDIVPGDIVIPHLLEWIRFHFPESERSAMNILNSIRFNQDIAINGAENVFPEYWDTVIGLMLQSNVDLARALLRLHSDADSDEFAEADKVLRRMPVFMIYGGISVSEYINLWKGWQATVRDKIQTGSFSSNPELDLIIKIISGDDAGFKKAKQYCSTWYQFMIASLLYTDPVVKSSDLCYHAHQCIVQYGGPKILKLLDMVVLALLDSDLKLAIKKFQLTSDCGWMATHLTNLLCMCGKLDDTVDKLDEEMSSPLDEQLVLEYGTLLMKHKSLWQVGLRYLDYCTNEGTARQQALLLMMPLDNESKIMKVLQAAQDRDLNIVVSTICKVQGQKCMRRNRLGDALVWALRSQDSQSASNIADKFLQQYSETGLFTSTDILDNLGSCMLLCDRLTFLGKYCDFHQLYGTGQLKEAAKLLSELLASKMAPKYFCLTLLSDALPLLENDEGPLFTSEETTNLMYCLEELLYDETVTSAVPCLEQKTKLIRLALAKNLTRAYVNEITNTSLHSNTNMLATVVK